MTSLRTLKILGISGSLRSSSANSGLIRAAAASAQRISQATMGYHLDFRMFPSLNMPLYNEDLEAQKPEPVMAFRQAISEVDALLIASPEYNYSVSGVLKNAIDWASRPYGHSYIVGKPCAILGAAGVSGSSRAQYHLRQILQGLDMPVLPKPEVMLNLYLPGKTNAKGDLLDEQLQKEIDNLLLALAGWTTKLRASI
jgi:chromate reductase